MMNNDNFEKISALRRFEDERNSKTGYLYNKDNLKTNSTSFTITSNYSHSLLQKYAMEALKEFESKIITRALELEEQDYNKVNEEAEKEMKKYFNL